MLDINVSDYQILGQFVISRHGFLSVTHILYFVTCFYAIQGVLFYNEDRHFAYYVALHRRQYSSCKIVVIDLQIVSCTLNVYFGTVSQGQQLYHDKS